MCYFNANNFFPFLLNEEDSVVHLHPFSENSIALMILKYGSKVFPVLTQYVKLVEASLKVCSINNITMSIIVFIVYTQVLHNLFQVDHMLTHQCAVNGLMFVFKTIMPLLSVSHFFIGPRENMDLGWACMRLIYVVSMLKPESEEDESIMRIKRVLDLCLPCNRTSIASLMILNIASIGEINSIVLLKCSHIFYQFLIKC